MNELSFFKGKKVLITGHTGFKGTWMSVMLSNAGAMVTGYALEDTRDPAFFELTGVKEEINHVVGDVRDLEHLRKVFEEVQPEIVVHMAAQPIVRESYQNPVYTYDTNVMGTVNILECVRLNPCVKSFLNVTTDKVYLNREWNKGYVEDDELDGYDPYSNSKSCSELVTHSYKRAFFENRDTAISTARAGNVIGGGDFSKDRIIPDCVRAAIKGEDIIVRNPYSTRPYQHVLEPICAYLLIVEKQYKQKKHEGWYNVGPDDEDCFETGNLVDLFIKHWGEGLQWVNKHDGGPHEANFLKLDSQKIKSKLGWQPRWNLDEAVARVVEWSQCWANKGNIRECMNKQIKEFLMG